MSIWNLLRPLALMVILVWLLTGAARAGEVQSLDSIRQAALAEARGAVPAGAELDASRLDARLQLVACPATLSTRTASDSGSALSVEVRCDALGWKLFVPVSVRVQVPVLVATRALMRGETPSAADVRVEQRERGTLGPAWIGAVEHLQGRVLTRPLAAGSLLVPGALALAKVVQRGQSVTLVGRSGSFQVRARGKALSDGAPGDRVRVENLSSRRVVEGQVLDDGSVAVAL